MAYLKVGRENGADTHLYYEDRGSGKPVVLIHGWPLNCGSWERQTGMLLNSGYRVVTYDRRGFGRSDAPGYGFDYDTMAGDLAKLIDALDLSDATLVGFSMGGGEVARYMGKYNSGKVSKVCFMASIAPALRKDGGNPDGVDPSVFEDIKGKIEKDRYVFLESFLKDFYNHKVLFNDRISDPAIHASFNVATMSSAYAMLNCVDAWLEDFRPDLTQIAVPTLVIHGDSDKILPFEATGARVPQYVPGATLHVIEGGPHGLNWTHATEVNKLLLEFLKS